MDQSESKQNADNAQNNINTKTSSKNDEQPIYKCVSFWILMGVVVMLIVFLVISLLMPKSKRILSDARYTMMMIVPRVFS